MNARIPGLQIPGMRQVAQGAFEEAAKAFTEALPGLRRGVNLLGWSHATVVPALVSLTQSPFKFYEAVPIVPPTRIAAVLIHVPIMGRS